MRPILKLLLLALLVSAVPAFVEEYGPPTLSPGDLENYQFENQPAERDADVDDLSFGQRFVISSMRDHVEELFGRHLGVAKIRGNQTDLTSIQRIVDMEVIKSDEVKTWQALGVVIGDQLAKDFGLHWVSMKDERGVSKALQWKTTQNFVFPITLLSKRIHFGEEIDLAKIYEKLRVDIESFKVYQSKQPNLQMPGVERLEVNKN